MLICNLMLGLGFLQSIIDNIETRAYAHVPVDGSSNRLVEVAVFIVIIGHLDLELFQSFGEGDLIKVRVEEPFEGVVECGEVGFAVLLNLL